MSKVPISVVITDTHLSESNIEINKSIFRQTIDLCKQLGLKEFDHAGDIFHSRKAQSQAVLTAFREMLEIIDDQGLIMHCIVGNHDKTDYNSIDSFLDPFKYHPGIKLCRDHNIRLKDHNIMIHYLSFFNDERYINYIDHIDNNHFFSDKNILITHIGCQGAVMNNGTKVESTINSNLFVKYDLVLTGHFHDPQQFDHIQYIGSSLQHNYGEGCNKGATIIYDDLSTELVPFNFPKYLKYEIDVTQLSAKEIKELKQEKESSIDNIRVILKGTEKDLKAFNVQSLREIGISVQLEQEKISIEDLEQRIEAFDSKTLLEEFKVFCTKNKLSEKQGMKYFDKIN